MFINKKLASTDLVTIHIDFVNGKHLQILEKGLAFVETNDSYIVYINSKKTEQEFCTRHIINKKHVMHIEFIVRKT